VFTSPIGVLVVEDDPDVGELVAYLLRRDPGLAVSLVVDGQEALAAAGASPPAVVVLDLSLPKVDGYEVARRLREDPATAPCWIIGLSGSGHADAALAAGCDQFLWKPAGIEEVEVAVRAGLLRAAERAGPARPPVDRGQ